MRAISKVEPAILLLQFKASVYSIPRKLNIIFRNIPKDGAVFPLIYSLSSSLIGFITTWNSKWGENNSTADKFASSLIVFLITLVSSIIIVPIFFLFSSVFLASILAPFRYLESKNTRSLTADDVTSFIALQQMTLDSENSANLRLKIPGIIPYTERAYNILHLCNAVGAFKIKSLFLLYEQKLFIYDLFQAIKKLGNIDILGKIIPYLKLEDITIYSKSIKPSIPLGDKSIDKLAGFSCISEFQEKTIHQENQVIKVLSIKRGDAYKKFSAMSMNQLYKRFCNSQQSIIVQSTPDIENQLIIQPDITNQTPLLRS